MKFSYSWLCDHLETDKNANEIGEALTNLGLELESLTDYSEYSKFVVATIKDFRKHPNADRLNICKVDDGTNTYQVICGANNVKKGLKGIFAKDGMYIPGTQINLKKGKIRGEISEGMLLSERELNLSDDHEGIIELLDDFQNGTSAVEALKLNDPIFEIGITPNRGDCLGVRGVARDLSAKGVGKLKPLNFKKINQLEFASPITWNINNDDNSCEYVVSRYFKNVNNSKSPEWLQKKLISLGLRPINALVDATPISGPACIGKTQSAFRAIVLSITLTIAQVFTLFFLQISKAAAVSAVSPDCETKIYKFLSLNLSFLYLNSDAISIVTSRSV